MTVTQILVMAVLNANTNVVQIALSAFKGTAMNAHTASTKKGENVLQNVEMELEYLSLKIVTMGRSLDVRTAKLRKTGSALTIQRFTVIVYIRLNPRQF